MPNKNYQRGFNAEKRCQDDLEKEGYWTQRSYGSKGCYDVIAVGRGIVRFIEVKRRKFKIVKDSAIENHYEQSLAALNEVPDQPYSQKELWVWFDKQGMVGEKGYIPAGWKKFRVYRTGFFPL